MIFKTNKEKGNSRYKKFSIAIIAISLFFLEWCVRDYNTIVLFIYEKIVYLVIISALVFIILSRCINTWFNIIIFKKRIILRDKSSVSKVIKSRNIKSIELCHITPENDFQGHIFGYKVCDIPDFLITMKDDLQIAVHCQTPEKMYLSLNKKLKNEYPDMVFIDNYKID